jgi:cell division protein FtsB
MPWITTLLFSFVLLLQYALWLGKGSLPHLQMVEENLSQQKQKNGELRLRNTAMEAEIQDLKRGYDAIEERARSDLGMVKPKEILYEYLNTPSDKIVVISNKKLKEELVDSEEKKEESSATHKKNKILD